MRRRLHVFPFFMIICLALAQCGCEKNNLLQSTDASSDPDYPAETEGTEEAGPDASCRDNDGDGYLDSACGGNDCNDGHSGIHPGAPEICRDGVDNDCDGLVDEPAFMLAGAPLNDETHGHGMDSGLDCNVTFAWTGSEFAVAWSYADALICPGPQRTYFTRLNESGMELTSDIELPYDTSLSCYSSARPRLAWTGSELGLVLTWVYVEADEIKRDLSLVRLNLSGEPLGDELLLTDPEIMSSCAGLSWTGSGFGIVWHEDNWGIYHDAIHFTTVNAVGSEAGADVIISSGQNRPAMVWTGSEFGVFRTEIISLEDSRYEIHMTRLDPLGEITSDGSKLFDITPVFKIELAWTGSAFALVWNEDRNRDGIMEIHFARVNPQGVPLSEDFIVYENASIESLGWNGTELGLIMREGEAISFGRMDAAGLDVKEKVDLAFLDGEIASWSDLIWTGSEFAVAWTVLRMGAWWEIYFNRINLCD